MGGGGGPRGPNEKGGYRGRGSNKREGGEYTPKGFFFPSMSKPLVNFQQFSSLQGGRQCDLNTLKKQYKEYCGVHRDRHDKAFWTEHEKEPWFMEQYNPMTVYQIK